MKIVSNDIINDILLRYIQKIDMDDDFRFSREVSRDIFTEFVDRYNASIGNDGEYQYYTSFNINTMLDNIEEAIDYFKVKDKKLALRFVELNMIMHRYGAM